MLYQLSYVGVPFSCLISLFSETKVIQPVGGEGFEPPKELLQLIYSQSPLATWVTAHARTVASSQVRSLSLTNSLASRQLSRRWESNP